MPTPTEQLLSRTVYATDGTTTNWDFSFSGGYLDKAHVKAYTEAPSGARVDITVLEAMLIGPYQLQVSPALASGLTLTIYRDTPKDLPLVDFTDESGFSEIALDTNAKQAVFIAAETVDTVNTSSAYDAEQAATAAEVAAAAAVAAAADIDDVLVDAQSAAATAVAAAASINPALFATAAQGVKADSALQPAAIGTTVASQANGALAATALQPAAIGITVQGYDVDTAKLDVVQSFTRAQRGGVLALTDAATVAVDLALANNFSLTIAGSRTLGIPTNQLAGQAGTIVIKQDATGSRTLAYSVNWKFPGGTAPALSTTGNAVDVLTYYVEDTGRITARLLNDVK